MYNELGILEASNCGMCDPRGGYAAAGQIGRWKNGNHMCKKWD